MRARQKRKNQLVRHTKAKGFPDNNDGKRGGLPFAAKGLNLSLANAAGKRYTGHDIEEVKPLFNIACK